jgi:Dihydrodipicolinate synthetase family
VEANASIDQRILKSARGAFDDMDAEMRSILGAGIVIPACPLALAVDRRFDERRQRALCRYYIASGAGGLAVGVHTTQFAIHDPSIGLLEPVLRVAAEELARCSRPLVRVGGICGPTRQATSEAELLRTVGFHAGLLSLAALSNADDELLISHCREVAALIPLVGFYLQPAVGGRVLSYRFWRRFLEVENVVAIKIAPFNRYQTLDVIRAVADSGRTDVALYTGNDDSIVSDLLTPFVFSLPSDRVPSGNQPARVLRIAGGLLGQWAVWTHKAVELLESCHEAARSGNVSLELLTLGAQLTECNAAIFDAANGFAGCIAGIHEVLWRQGLLQGIWCLEPRETLSPGQAEEIDRVRRAYPHLTDDAFVAEHLDEWLRP